MASMVLFSTALYKAFEKRDSASKPEKPQLSPVQQEQQFAVSPSAVRTTAPVQIKLIDGQELQRFVHDVQAADGAGVLSGPCEVDASLQPMFMPHTRRGLTLTIKDLQTLASQQQQGDGSSMGGCSSGGKLPLAELESLFRDMCMARLLATYTRDVSAGKAVHALLDYGNSLLRDLAQQAQQQPQQPQQQLQPQQQGQQQGQQQSSSTSPAAAAAAASLPPPPPSDLLVPDELFFLPVPAVRPLLEVCVDRPLPELEPLGQQYGPTRKRRAPDGFEPGGRGGKVRRGGPGRGRGGGGRGGGGGGVEVREVYKLPGKIQQRVARMLELAVLPPDDLAGRSMPLDSLRKSPAAEVVRSLRIDFSKVLSRLNAGWYDWFDDIHADVSAACLACADNYDYDANPGVRRGKMAGAAQQFYQLLHEHIEKLEFATIKLEKKRAVLESRWEQVAGVTSVGGIPGDDDYDPRNLPRSIEANHEPFYHVDEWRKEPYIPRPYERLSEYRLQQEQSDIIEWKLTTEKRGSCGGDHCKSHEGLGTFNFETLSFESKCSCLARNTECDDGCGCAAGGCLNRAVGSKRPLALGVDVGEIDTWGIDCYTRRNIHDAVLESEAFGPYVLPYYEPPLVAAAAAAAAAAATLDGQPADAANASGAASGEALHQPGLQGSASNGDEPTDADAAAALVGLQLEAPPAPADADDACAQAQAAGGAAVPGSSAAPPVGDAAAALAAAEAALAAAASAPGPEAVAADAPPREAARAPAGGTAAAAAAPLGGGAPSNRGCGSESAEAAAAAAHPGPGTPVGDASAALGTTPVIPGTGASPGAGGPNPNKEVEEKVTAWVERVLIPAINSQKRDGWDICKALEWLRQRARETGDEVTIKAADAIEQRVKLVGYSYFRVHPKGVGLQCMRQGGLPPLTLIQEYYGEIHTPWRWFEIQDAVKKMSKDELPEFYNMTMERPKDDRLGYDCLFIEAASKGSFASRMSHSCTPNCQAVVMAAQGKLTVAMYTTRHIQPGEELTFDYSAVTESEKEFRAATCLCGTRGCRGSFLAFAGSRAFSTVIVSHHHMLHRQVMLLRAAAEPITDEDRERLQRHGIKEASLGCTAHGGRVPPWLEKWSALVMEWVELEARLLPRELMVARPPYPPLPEEVARIEAQGVSMNRLSNVVITLDKIKYCLSRMGGVYGPPLYFIQDKEVVEHLWTGIRSIAKRVLVCGCGSLADSGVAKALAGAVTIAAMRKLVESHGRSHPKLQRVGLLVMQTVKTPDEARTKLLELSSLLREMDVADGANHHTAAADVLLMYGHTKHWFVAERDYKGFLSSAVELNLANLNLDRTTGNSGSGPADEDDGAPIADAIAPVADAIPAVDAADAPMALADVQQHAPTEAGDGTQGEPRSALEAALPPLPVSRGKTLAGEEGEAAAAVAGAEPADAEEALGLVVDEQPQQRKSTRKASNVRTGQAAALDRSALQKKYGPLFIWGQLNGWYKQTVYDPTASLSAERRGTISLPDVESCYGSGSRQYSGRDRDAMLEHIAKRPDVLWRTAWIWSFRNESKIYGSPWFDGAWAEATGSDDNPMPALLQALHSAPAPFRQAAGAAAGPSRAPPRNRRAFAQVPGAEQQQPPPAATRFEQDGGVGGDGGSDELEGRPGLSDAGGAADAAPAARSRRGAGRRRSGGATPADTDMQEASQ